MKSRMICVGLASLSLALLSPIAASASEPEAIEPEAVAVEPQVDTTVEGVVTPAPKTVDLQSLLASHEQADEADLSATAGLDGSDWVYVGIGIALMVVALAI